jgi:hypothetical protein
VAKKLSVAKQNKQSVAKNAERSEAISVAIPPKKMSPRKIGTTPKL